MKRSASELGRGALPIFATVGQRLSRALRPTDLWRLSTRQTLIRDAFAGLTGASLALPQSVAFAAIAGLPPQYGFYSAITIPIVAALFGSSFHTVSGPATAISALVFGALAGLYVPGSAEFCRAAVLLALTVGALQLAFGLARLGGLVAFVSHSVMTGFVAGAAILIALSQLPSVLGLDLPRPEQPLAFVSALVREVGQSDAASVAIGVLTLASAWGVRRLRPSWPNYLIALAVGTALYLGLGKAASQVAVIGSVGSVIPRPGLPDAPVGEVLTLFSPALAIALVGLLEASVIARGLALRSGQEIDYSREFTGQGLANIAGGIFGGFPGSASFTRSGVNYDAGAATPLAAVFGAAFLLVILLFVAPWFAHVPVPAMAGVILLVAWRLVDVHSVLHMMRLSAAEAMIAIVTFACALFVDLEASIYVGVFLSTILFMERSSRPHVSVGIPNLAKPGRPFEARNDDPTQHCPQFVVAGIDGPLFFGSVDALRREFRHLEDQFPTQHYMVLLIKGVGRLDMPAAELLGEEAERRKARGGGLLIQTKLPDTLQRLNRFGVTAHLFGRRVFIHKGEAVASLFGSLSPDPCQDCALRLYRECEGLAQQGAGD